VKGQAGVRPHVSVVLAVHNGEAYVAEAVQSVLAQDYEDFELVVVDDGSTDGTLAMVQSFHDPRIHVLRSSANSGLAAALNLGVAESRGQYIARQDDDDISVPGRLSQLCQYLDAHPECVLVGSQLAAFCSQTEDDGIRAKALDFERWFSDTTGIIGTDTMLRGNQLLNGTTMYRRAAWEAAGGYNPEFELAQDYDFNLRMMMQGELFKIAAKLYRYRVHPGQVSIVRHERQRYFDALAKIDWCLRQGILAQQQPCRIWGAGSGGAHMLAACRDRSITVVEALDSDPLKLGTAFEDVVVRHPESVDLRDGIVTLIATAPGRAAIVRALEAMGLVYLKHFVPLA
jgi:glycosyltransferase involved in cell wall biosynthesis